MTAIPSMLQTLIKDNPILILSKSYCPYCIRAIRLFQSHRVILDHHLPIKIIQLDEESWGSEMQREAAKVTGRRTVPNIWIKGENVGGCDDVVAMDKHGGLTMKLLALTGSE